MVFFVLLTLGFIFELGKNALTIDSRQTSFYNNVDTAMSHAFLSSALAKLVSTKSLKSTTDLAELAAVIAAIASSMPKLALFINQFDSTVAESAINVLTDCKGNMSIQTPYNMPDAVVNQLSAKVQIIDRLIHTKQDEISNLVEKGLEIQNRINTINPSYKSEIFNQITEFKKLSSSYKH